MQVLDWTRPPVLAGYSTQTSHQSDNKYKFHTKTLDSCAELREFREGMVSDNPLVNQLMFQSFSLSALGYDYQRVWVYDTSINAQCLNSMLMYIFIQGLFIVGPAHPCGPSAWRHSTSPFSLRIGTAV